jgi:hypothetical protein
VRFGEIVSISNDAPLAVAAHCGAVGSDEPEGFPLRLCDTKGLELAAFEKILADLEAEIERGISSGKVEDRIHILWLCIAEPGARVEAAEEQVIAACERHRIPAIVVLTKAIGPRGGG